MDAFFAAIEEREHPELHFVPMAVGHDEQRGVIATANYEARKHGIHSALSSFKAKQLCPQLIILPGRMEVYKEVSEQIHQIFLDYTDIIEPLSIDEAFLDVTENKKQIEKAVDIAIEIKRRIHDELHLVASAGISYNKFLAKIASDYRKPDGLCTIHPDIALDFIAKLPIESFWGVGPVTARSMHMLNINNGEQLRACSKEMLIRQFGKAGSIYYDFARGIDERPVIPTRIRKSIGCEHTLEKDIKDRSAVIIELYHVALELEERLQQKKFHGITLTMKIKYNNFNQITRSITLPKDKHLDTLKEILAPAKQLLKQVDYSQSSIRLIGLSVSNPIDEKIVPQKEHYTQLKINFDF